MADPAEIRSVLREHGHAVPARGRISAEDLERYSKLVNGGQAADPGPDAGDYDAGVSAADFPDDPGGDGQAPPMTERAPRRPARGRKAGASLRDRLSGKQPGGAARPGKARKGRRLPRVPVDRLIERGWEVMARIAAPVSPPVSRCLAVQSPVAGLILEDVIRDTAADRVLQPLARAEEKAEKVIALVAPPVIVGALQAAQGLPEDQRMMRQAILVPMLRESMVLWVKIAGDKVTEKATRDAEMAPIYAKVDELMAFIAQEPEQAPEPAAAGV